MKVITTTEILFEHETHPVETLLDLPKDAAQSLIHQGVARPATKTVEMPVDDEPEAPAAPKTTAVAPQTPPAEDGKPEQSAESEPVKVSKDLSREKLDEIATAEGLTDLERFENKADLVQAIKDHRAAAQPKQ